jgi:hypothetical protein
MKQRNEGLSASVSRLERAIVPRRSCYRQRFAKAKRRHEWLAEKTLLITDFFSLETLDPQIAVVTIGTAAKTSPLRVASHLKSATEAIGTYGESCQRDWSQTIHAERLGKEKSRVVFATWVGSMGMQGGRRFCWVRDRRPNSLREGTSLLVGKAPTGRTLGRIFRVGNFGAPLQSTLA